MFKMSIAIRYEIICNANFNAIPTITNYYRVENFTELSNTYPIFFIIY